MAGSDDKETRRTPLHDLHVELGGRMVPFAGYSMPVQYPMGILGEHRHTREAAGLFDVSHMGQVTLRGAGAAQQLERLVPADIVNLAPGRMRYTQFTNESGGILDDLMVTNRGDDLLLVVNAACKDADFEHMRANLTGLELLMHEDRALLALQGPKAAEVLARFAPESAGLGFMRGGEMAVDGIACFVTRSGYTGEDGFEISVPEEAAEHLARTLLGETEVAAIGLGARDSLRLEAGLCLYGHDIDQTTTPVEADLVWSIQKRRREEGGFAGDDVIRRQLREGPPRRRVGLLPEDRAPAREGTEIRLPDGRRIGTVTSGGFGPSVDRPVAMGYVEAAHAAAGTEVELMVRGKARPAGVAALPFRPSRYFKG